MSGRIRRTSSSSSSHTSSIMSPKTGRYIKSDGSTARSLGVSTLEDQNKFIIENVYLLANCSNRHCLKERQRQWRVSPGYPLGDGCTRLPRLALT